MPDLRRHEETSDNSGSPIKILEWAVDGGIDGTRQMLGIDLTPGPTRVAKTRAATGRSLVTNGLLGADLLHLPAGEGFAPHTHPGDHLLFVVGGYGTITIDGTITATRPGNVYLVRGSVPHAVGATTDHVILAVGAPHRRLESEERQELTEYAAVLSPLGTLHCRICAVTADEGELLVALGCPHAPHRYV